MTETDSRALWNDTERRFEQARQNMAAHHDAARRASSSVSDPEAHAEWDAAVSRIEREARSWLAENPDDPKATGHRADVLRLRREVERAIADHTQTLSSRRISDLRAELTETRDAAWQRMQDVLAAAEGEGRDLRRSEAARWDADEVVLAEAAIALERSRVFDPITSDQHFGTQESDMETATMRRDAPLTSEQRFVDWVDRFGDRRSDDHADLNLGLVVRGMLTGRWDGAEAEYRAMGITPGSAGGFTVPERLAAQVLDLARAETQVMRAGATVWPLDTDTTNVPKITSDAQAAWRAEHGVIPEDDVTFGRVQFKARALAVIVRMSRELLEDGQNIEETVRQAIARSIAVEIDGQALRGDGASANPTGVRHTSGVTVTALGAGDGAAPTYDDLSDSIGRVEDANYPPTGIIWAPRTARYLANLTDTQGRYLDPPSTVADVPRFKTTQVPTNLTTGLNTDTSEIYTGDFRQLFIGLRTTLQITALVERYADVGEVGFLAWYRGDVQVARAEAFDVLTGVRAA